MYQQVDLSTWGKDGREAASGRRTGALMWLVSLALAPAIVLAGEFLDAPYYLTSVLVIICTMVPFFMSFESRKPQARELVIIAVLCAIAVAARAAFMWLPSFKPLVGIVMVAGIAFGAQAGFLTGAVAAFVSNFIFGQGPWTPWQMFAFGIAGFAAGALAKAGIVSRSGWNAKQKAGMATFGFAFVLCVVGPILDTCSLFTMISSMSAESAAAIYLSGLPFNAVHGVATAITLFLVGNPMLEKLDRVRVKYGMME